MNDYFTRNISDGEIVIWNKSIETNNFSIRLTYPHYDGEGSVALILNINSNPIYYLSFTIVPGHIFNMPDDHILYITRMQGGGNRFDLIKCATKSLYEISPPALLLIAVRAIATALNIASIAGITVHDHAYLGRLPTADHYFSNYDKFWTSVGGKKINDNAYILQTIPDEKPLSDIKQSHRRRTKIKRQRQIDIMGQICQTFEQLCLRAKLKPPLLTKSEPPCNTSLGSGESLVSS